MNIYDTEHVTTAHPLMSDEEFRETYLQAWNAFYTHDHVETIIRRAAVYGIRTAKVMRVLAYFYGSQAIEGIHPLQGGLFRRKYRRDRRFGMPIENPLVFYPRYLWEIISKTVRIYLFLRPYKRIQQRVENDPGKDAYMDLALSPTTDENLETLDLLKPAAGKPRPKSVEPAPMAATG